MKKTLPLLVVDDRWLMRQAITSALYDMGFDQVIQASTGLEAMRTLQVTPVAAVISDWDMPGMNGIGLLRWVRSKPEYTELPFMMVSAEASLDQVRIAIEAGVSEYMVKPFTIQDLANKVTRLLGKQRHSMRVREGEKVLGLTDASDVEEQIAGSKILIVDDAPSNIEIIAEILKGEYSIDVAHSGAQALQKVRSSQPPSLILLDIMMPDMDGYSVCTQLKADPATRDIPIIFLTGKDEVDDIVKGLEIGAVDYIAKPAEPGILKARIRTHLRLKLAFADMARQNASLVTSAKQREDVERITQHDLKNPLSAIIMNADLLLKDTRLGEQHKALIEQIQSGAWRTLDLVNQSLSLYQMETGSFTLNPEPVDLAETLLMIQQETLAAFAGLRLDIKLLTREDTTVQPGRYIASGEKGLCYSLFVNLVRNAAEASPEGAVIDITFMSDKETIMVMIHNSQTVPLDIRARFFEKYTTAGKERGTGLGTYTAKLVAEAQHGSLAMTTDEITGTTLTVRLPKA